MFGPGGAPDVDTNCELGPGAFRLAPFVHVVALLGHAAVGHRGLVEAGRRWLGDLAEYEDSATPGPIVAIALADSAPTLYSN